MCQVHYHTYTELLAETISVQLDYTVRATTAQVTIDQSSVWDSRPF